MSKNKKSNRVIYEHANLPHHSNLLLISGEPSYITMWLTLKIYNKTFFQHLFLLLYKAFFPRGFLSVGACALKLSSSQEKKGPKHGRHCPDPELKVTPKWEGCGFSITPGTVHSSFQLLELEGAAGV